MANFLLDALQGVGNVLDTPGSIVRGLLSGDGDRAINGILDPSQRVSGRDMLNKWGVTDENSGVAGDIGGFAASLATDPLMLAGTGVLGKMLGRSGKVAEAAEAASNAGRSAGGAQTLLEAAPGVGGYKKLADGTISRIEAAPARGTIDSLGNKLMGGPGGMSDAEAWTGRRMSAGTPGATTADMGAASVTSNGGVSNLLPLRRDFTVVKGMGTDPFGRLTGEAVGGVNSAARAKDVNRAVGLIGSDMADAAQVGGTLHGAYIPGLRTAGIAEGAGPGTLRHEMMHGLIDVARDTGATDKLSMLPRLSANLQDTASPTLQSLGLLGEETAAHAAGAGRGFMNQAKGGLDFLMKPNHFYGNQLADKSPLIAALYGTQALPRAGAFGAGLAGGVPAAYLMSQLGGE